MPGLQIDGYFPDSSTTNSNNGWFHDSQYATRPQAVKDAVAVVHVVAALDRVEAVHRAAAGVAHEPGVDFAVVADREKGVRRFPDRLRPILPCQRSVFAALERWVERGGQPPPTQFVGKPTSGEVVNRCALALR